MQGPIRCALVSVMLLGCDTGDTTIPMDDALIEPVASGLVVEWSSSPSMWPITMDGVTLIKARFGMKSLRVVGDAGPGDPRTTATAFDMGFAWSSVEDRPASIAFDDAPPGLYSQVAIAFDRLASESQAYELRGTVDVNGDDYGFTIKDSRPLAFNVAIDETLSPGEQATIHVRINFMTALGSIAWSSVNISNGRKVLDEGDSQMPVFRRKLVESFEIVNVAAGRAR